MKNIGKSLLFAVLFGTAAIAVVTALQYQETRDDVHELATVVASSQQPQPARPVSQPAREHVIHLPEDGNRWYTTLVTSAHYQSNPQERELLTWFQIDPRLSSLRAQTQWTHYKTSGDRLYASRYAAYATPNEAPCIVVQMPNGQQCFKANTATMPRTPEELADAIQTRINDCRPRPTPPPVTPPPTTPVVAPPQGTPPDMGPPRDVPKGSDPTTLISIAVAAFALSFVAALVSSVVGEIKKKIKV